jgi:hypothetical protein
LIVESPKESQQGRDQQQNGTQCQLVHRTP